MGSLLRLCGRLCVPTQHRVRFDKRHRTYRRQLPDADSLRCELCCPAGNNLAGLSANGYAAIFPSGLVPITGNTLGAKTGAGTSVSFIDPDFKPDYVNQFNAGFDLQLPSQMVFHVEYNGSRAHNVPLSVANPGKSIDQVTATQFLTLGSALNTQVTNPFKGLLPGTSVYTSGYRLRTTIAHSLCSIHECD